MNIFSVIGLSLAMIVLFVGLRLSSDSLGMFIDYTSMFIVIGGTIAATAISFQLDRIIMLFKVFFHRMLMGKKPDYKGIIMEVMQIADAYRKGDSLENHISKVNDPFFSEALTLVHDDIVDADEIVEILNQRIQNMYYLYMEDAGRIKSVGKFPPAFGMMGTTIGMIVLLANLGGADAIKKIGPAMGVCLITTLYGVAIANLAIVPVAENLVDSSKELYLKNRIILEGVKLLIQKTNPVVVAERLNSYLPPSERLDWKFVLGK